VQSINVIIEFGILTGSFFIIYELSLYAEDPDQTSTEYKDIIPIAIGNYSFFNI
jgi:hypothetical protein